MEEWKYNLITVSNIFNNMSIFIPLGSDLFIITRLNERVSIILLRKEDNLRMCVMDYESLELLMPVKSGEEVNLFMSNTFGMTSIDIITRIFLLDNMVIKRSSLNNRGIFSLMDLESIVNIEELGDKIKKCEGCFEREYNLYGDVYINKNLFINRIEISREYLIKTIISMKPISKKSLEAAPFYPIKNVKINIDNIDNGKK